jgi:hypothetical protein
MYSAMQNLAELVGCRMLAYETCLGVIGYLDCLVTELKIPRVGLLHTLHLADLP